MGTTCYNCIKYPLCRAFTDINKIIDKESIFKQGSTIFHAVAKECSYYKPNLFHENDKLRKVK